jgi:hypothetical protein
LFGGKSSDDKILDLADMGRSRLRPYTFRAENKNGVPVNRDAVSIFTIR